MLLEGDTSSSPNRARHPHASVIAAERYEIGSVLPKKKDW